MKIKYVKQIEGSPVVQFVAQAWCALMDQKQWDNNSVLVSGELSCVYATINRKIVGCLTWHMADEALASVNLAFVDPKYRGKGVYSALHAEFVTRAKADGAKRIVNICYPSNTGIQETCKKLGYHPHELHLVLDLK